MTAPSAFRLRDEAAKWVARMDAGHWSDAEEAALLAWLAGDARRQGALLQAQAAWMTLDERKLDAADGGGGGGEDTAPHYGRRTLLIASGSALAASLIGGWVWSQAATRFVTALGEVRRVPLADGSIASINTQTAVGVRMHSAQRDILIENGEAWFQVAKDARRPFVVEAGRVRVRAVGTAFSVRRRAEGADVLVTEGTVEAWVEGAEGHTVRLSAGQKAFVADNSAITEANIGTPSIDRALAWRYGKIDLAGEQLAEAVREFNRYNVRQVLLVDPALGTERFDGVFRLDDPEGFAKSVQVALGVPVNLSDPVAIRIGRQNK